MAFDLRTSRGLGKVRKSPGNAPTINWEKKTAKLASVSLGCKGRTTINWQIVTPLQLQIVFQRSHAKWGNTVKKTLQTFYLVHVLLKTAKKFQWVHLFAILQLFLLYFYVLKFVIFFILFFPQARLLFFNSIRVVLANGMRLLGITPLDKM